MFDEVTGDINLCRCKLAPKSIEDVNPVSGKMKIRQVYVPTKEMRQLHNNLIKYLSQRIELSPHLYGSVAGGSPTANVRTHIRAGGKSFYVVDIKDAFSGVDPKKLVEAVEVYAGKSHSEISQFLHRYFINPSGGIYMGAPASPFLFNLFVQHYIIPELNKICDNKQLCFTVYLDDFCFSRADQPIGLRVRRNIRSIITKFGFDINNQKTRFTSDIRIHPFSMTGITIKYCNESNTLKVGVNQRYINKVIVDVEGILDGHSQITFLELDKLRGKVAFVRQIAKSNNDSSHCSSKENYLFRLFDRLTQQIKSSPDLLLDNELPFNPYNLCGDLDDEYGIDENFL